MGIAVVVHNLWSTPHEIYAVPYNCQLIHVTNVAHDKRWRVCKKIGRQLLVLHSAATVPVAALSCSQLFAPHSGDW